MCLLDGPSDMWEHGDVYLMVQVICGNMVVFIKWSK